MSMSLRWSGALAAAVLLFIAGPALTQAPAVMTKPAPGVGTGPNPGGVGPAAPSAYGGVTPSAPMVNPTAGALSNPYALSTVGGYNPYLASSAAMSSTPANTYSMSTMPGGYFPFFPGYGFGSPWGRSPFANETAATGYLYQGMADLTRATGQYWKDTQQAALLREGVRQASLDTVRRRIEFEMWYDTVRPTAIKMRAQELNTDLDNARLGATDAEITSGKALNTLLANIQKASKLHRGPGIELDEDTVKHLNVSTGAAGNIGLLKDGGKLPWPEGLQDKAFEDPRERLAEKMVQAVGLLKDREPVRSDLLKDIRGNYKALSDRLDEGTIDLSTTQQIEARRFLRQLSDAIKALESPNAVKYFNNTWIARGNTVAALVEGMTKAGLTFAPAAPGDEGAYRAAYQALRAFEAGMQTAQR